MKCHPFLLGSLTCLKLSGKCLIRLSAIRIVSQSLLIQICLQVAIFHTVVVGGTVASVQFPSAAQIAKAGIAVTLEDYASLPLSSRTTDHYPPSLNFANQLGRVNFLRSEPSDAPLSRARFFVSDQNRNLYILNRSSREFTPYINFEEVFPKFDNNPGYSAGVVTFAFDPDYARNGTFFTVHTEDPALPGPGEPSNEKLPGLEVRGYTTSAPVNPPVGSVEREAVLVEWRDTNIWNQTFEGSAREILRIGFSSTVHPLGDLTFNPKARPGDPDYRNLYLAWPSGHSAGARRGWGTVSSEQKRWHDPEADGSAPATDAGPSPGP